MTTLLKMTPLQIILNSIYQMLMLHRELEEVDLINKLSETTSRIMPSLPWNFSANYARTKRANYIIRDDYYYFPFHWAAASQHLTIPRYLGQLIKKIKIYRKKESERINTENSTWSTRSSILNSRLVRDLVMPSGCNITLIKLIILYSAVLSRLIKILRSESAELLHNNYKFFAKRYFA